MGNIVIGQSGGPTAVINSSLAGAIHAAKQMEIPKIYGMHYGIQGFLKEDLIDLGEEYIKTREDCKNLFVHLRIFFNGRQLKAAGTEES